MSDKSRTAVQVSLHPHFFAEKKRLFIESGALKAELFLYDSGGGGRPTGKRCE